MRILSISFLLVFLMQNQSVSAKDLLQKKGSIQSIRDTYLSVLKKYRRQMCSTKEINKFHRLMKKYRAQAFYTPYTNDEKIDVEAIKDNMPILKEKLEWIKSTKKKLQNSKANFYVYREDVKELKQSILDLLEYRKHRLLDRKIANVSKEEEKLQKKIKENFNAMMEDLFYLKNFKYPVDHLANRVEYLNKRKDSRIEGNKQFFYRKLLEDGAYSKKNTSYDMYLRTTLDTLALRFAKKNYLFDENMRFDIEWSLDQIEQFLRKGKKEQLRRFDEWTTRTQKSINFYEDLLDPTHKDKLEKIAKDRQKAQEELKDFVYYKQARSFEYLSHYKLYIRALFAMDQILLNEVGAATPANYRERRDVAQVVINRHDDPKYFHISKNQILFEKLKEKTKFKSSTINDYPWLSTLYKQGEFSFTYHYFEASQYLFCPDMYKVARNTRSKNLALAIDILRRPNYDFAAVKYYSRKSMVGKISAEELWPDATIIPERPGVKIKNNKAILKSIQKRDFTYLYTFSDKNKIENHVIKWNDREYVVQNIHDKPTIYAHRNPHYFTYFK